MKKVLCVYYGSTEGLGSHALARLAAFKVRLQSHPELASSFLFDEWEWSRPHGDKVIHPSTACDAIALIGVCYMGSFKVNNTDVPCPRIRGMRCEVPVFAFSFGDYGTYAHVDLPGATVRHHFNHLPVEGAIMEDGAIEMMTNLFHEHLSCSPAHEAAH